MRTAESVSPIAAPAVAASLAAFVVVYFCVFGAGIWYLFRLFAHPPEAHEEGPRGHEAVRSAGLAPGAAAAHGSTGHAQQPAE